MMSWNPKRKTKECKEHSIIKNDIEQSKTIEGKDYPNYQSINDEMETKEKSSR